MIVGINQYAPPVSPTGSGTNDADDLRAALGRFGVAQDHELVLEDGAATYPAVVRAIAWLASQAGPSDVAVFSFAGHAKLLGPGRPALVTADDQHLLAPKLARLLASVHARQLWLNLATCYAGGFSAAVTPGRLLTGAAPADSEADVDPTTSRSFFNEYLVGAGLLGGAADSSVQAAFAYTRQALAESAPAEDPVELDAAGGSLTLGTPLGPPESSPMTPAAAPAPAGTAPDPSRTAPSSGPPPSPPNESSPPPCRLTRLVSGCR